MAAFVGGFALVSLVLGWVFWNSSLAQIGVGMLAVPVISAMLASQGFSWKRKLTYAGATLGLYLLGSAVAEATGIVALASEQILDASSLPSLPVVLYMAYLSTFPLVMLVLFVGRTPSLLWSRKSD